MTNGMKKMVLGVILMAIGGGMLLLASVAHT